MPTTPPSMTPTPTNLPQRGQRSTFSGFLDDFIAWLPTGVTNFGAAMANVYANTVEAFNSAVAAAASAAAAAASATSAMASANVVVWVSGATYAQYSVVVSPITKIAYRKVSTSTGGTTDPSLDLTYTNWKPLYGVGDHQVIVSVGNGAGSTNTAIRRYTTINRNVGADITYADSAVNGATFTINAAGLYEISVRDSGATAGTAAGASVNTTQPTVAIGSATGAVCYTIVGTSGASVTKSVRLAAGDVVRSHGLGNATTLAEFSIVRVG